jgi:protein gp37
MNITQIAWTLLTWNVFSGCASVSPGCKFCYARWLAEAKRGTLAFPDGFDLTIRLHKLLEPFKPKEPSLIFINSMSDLFWEKVSDNLRHQIMGVVRATPQHQYQSLTKRPDEMLRYHREFGLPENFWAGVSVESQSYAWRADRLREVNVPIRFLSIEPLLGPVSLDYSGLSWVIVGGESGKHLNKPEHAGRALVEKINGKWVPRADRIDWVRQVRDDVRAAGLPFFFKQWGGPKSYSSGNELDGERWEQLPNPVAAS